MHCQLKLSTSTCNALEGYGYTVEYSPSYGLINIDLIDLMSLAVCLREMMGESDVFFDTLRTVTLPDGCIQIHEVGL